MPGAAALPRRFFPKTADQAAKEQVKELWQQRTRYAFGLRPMTTEYLTNLPSGLSKQPSVQVGE